MTNNDADTAARKRSRWARWWLIAIVVLFAIGIGLSLWLNVAGDPAKQFTISPETTVLTEPLTVDGLIDYAEAIRIRNREEVPPDQNAARLLLEAMGPSVFNNKEEAQQAYEQLEMEPLPAEGEYLAYLRDVAGAMQSVSRVDSERVRLITGDQLEHCMRVPWSAEDAPEIAEWIDRNSVPLQKAHAACTLPHYRPPVLESPDRVLMVMLLPMVNPAREFNRLLAARAMQAIANGDLSIAWDDIRRAHRLAALHSDGYTLTDYFVACSLSAIATNAMPELLAAPGMTRELLTEIRSEWSHLHEWRDVVEIVDSTERYVVLDFIQQCTRNGSKLINVLVGLWHEDVKLPDHDLMNLALNCVVDWNSVMMRANEVFDQFAIVFEEANHAERELLMQQFNEERERFSREIFGTAIPWSNPNRDIGGRVLAYLWPSARNLHQVLLRRDARFALVDTALAVELYRFDHGRIPDSLAELVPEYLNAMPLDPCPPCDELRYVVHPDNAYVLYSVGHDGVDDGGTSVRDDVIFQVRMPVPEMPRFEPTQHESATDPAAKTELQ